jgi:hypothetical protein
MPKANGKLRPLGISTLRAGNRDLGYRSHALPIAFSLPSSLRSLLSALFGLAHHRLVAEIGIAPQRPVPP